MSAPFVGCKGGEKRDSLSSLQVQYTIYPYKSHVVFGKNINRIFRRGPLRTAAGFDKSHLLTNGKIWYTILLAAGVVRQMTSFIPFSCFALLGDRGAIFLWRGKTGCAWVLPRGGKGLVEKENTPTEVGVLKANQRWPLRRELRFSVMRRSESLLSDCCMNCFRRASKSAGPAVCWAAVGRVSRGRPPLL